MPAASTPARTDGPDVGCAVVAHGVVRVLGDAMQTYRKEVRLSGGQPLPGGLLKHAEDQTVAALAAIFQAIDGLGGGEFQHWGVVAAPRFLGRFTVAKTLERFADEGAWGVSPHVVPHCSLHAVSGTISQVLGIRGPNFGVGGGPDSAAKSLLASSSLLQDDTLPGVWLVLCGWNWEPGFGAEWEMAHARDGKPALCSAAALALQRHADHSQWRLRIGPGRLANDHDATPAFGLEELCDALTGTEPARTWRLPCGGWLRLERSATDRSKLDRAA